MRRASRGLDEPAKCGVDGLRAAEVGPEVRVDGHELARSQVRVVTAAWAPTELCGIQLRHLGEGFGRGLRGFRCCLRRCVAHGWLPRAR